LLLPVVLEADQVTLKNGDRITGTILSTEEKTLAVKTEAMGEIRIERSAIAALSSDEPLTVTLTKGDKVVGKLRAKELETLITTAEGKVVTVERAEVEAIRTASAQAAWDREQVRRTHPPLNDFWSGTIDLNLASASGNAKTTTFGTGASASRITGSDKIVLTYSQIYSRQSTVAPFGATANRISGGVRYDRNFTDRLFGFAMNAYDYDRFLDLDLRSVVGGGLGVHVYKTARSYFDVAGGAGWNREKFGTGLVRNSGELIVSEESAHQVTSILKLFQHASVFPNLSSGGDYRLNFDGGASLKLTRALSWNVTLTDRYLSNPLPGKRKNDTLLTTGIGISFEQR
jgi:putative salt-induced outer membrane protein YdiY